MMPMQTAVMDKLQHGDKLVVDAYDRSGQTKLATGYLLTVDNQIDAATGTIKLKAQFANESYKLFPNQFVNVRMLLDMLHGVTLMPTTGVQRGPAGYEIVYLTGYSCFHFTSPVCASRHSTRSEPVNSFR